MAEKKGIFDKAIDALTNRDEKAAAEEAKKVAAEAAKKKTEAEALAKAAKLKATQAEAAKNKAADIKREEAAKKFAEERAKQAAKPKVLAEHTVASGETLSAISQKYYGSAVRTYWEVIYEANKAAIGDNPGMIKVGTKLVIPELPQELKK